MFFWTVKWLFFSFLLIWLMHHIYLFFQNVLTVPKTKDLVATQLTFTASPPNILPAHAPTAPLASAYTLPSTSAYTLPSTSAYTLPSASANILPSAYTLPSASANILPSASAPSSTTMQNELANFLKDLKKA